MQVEIDRNADEPVYLQVARQVREAVADGRLVPGQGLPSVRTLASDLAVNLNTIARAYRLLEEEGFLAIRSRRGVEVRAPGDGLLPGVRAGLLEELRVVLARLRQGGLSGDELRRLAADEVDRLVPDATEEGA